MATTKDFIEYALSQVESLGNIRYIKMMGEYLIYVDEKPILLVCDNTVFVKMLPVIKEFMEGAETACPYKGAKEHYILDIDNREFAMKITRLLADNTPLKIKKSRK